MSQLVMLKKLKLNGSNEDLQDLLELTPPKDTLFIIGDWNANVGSQEIYGVTGKFALQVQNETGQRLTDFCQENTMIIANTLFQQMREDTMNITRQSIPETLLCQQSSI